MLNIYDSALIKVALPQFISIVGAIPDSLCNKRQCCQASVNKHKKYARFPLSMS